MHKPWQCSLPELEDILGSKQDSGLSHNEVLLRAEIYGRNKFEVEEKVVNLL